MPYITKTTKPIKESQILRRWHLIDVSEQILGRVAGKISILLQGKDKVSFVPYLDQGDFVVVINSCKVKISGHKDKDKIYTHYSGYPGGLKKINFNDLLKKNPNEIIKRAVLGMLPKNKLRDRRTARLFIFADDRHPYEDKFKASSLTKIAEDKQKIKVKKLIKK